MRIKLTTAQKNVLAEYGDREDVRRIFKIPQKKVRTVTEYHRAWLMSKERDERHKQLIQAVYDEVKAAYPANEDNEHRVYAETEQGTKLYTLYFDRDFHMDSLRTQDADNEDKMTRQEQITKFLHLSEPELADKLTYALRLRSSNITMNLFHKIWNIVRESMEKRYRDYKGIIRKIFAIDIDGHRYYVRGSNYEGHFVKFEWCGEVDDELIQF